jgi:cytochrome c oxidase subunit 2
VTSYDVIHSFWVPSMGIKVDANPGMTTSTSTTPDRLGTYTVRCAELCGLLHADMETEAKVVSTDDFDSWVAGQGGHT